MDRAILVSKEDITKDNIHLLLAKSELFKKKLPQYIDGWYVAGLCYLVSNNKNEALYNLTQAYKISPEDKILALIEEMGGKIEKTNIYQFKNNLKHNKNIFYNIVVLIMTITFLIVFL